jgi:L-rhamnose-H+ transport protein
LPVLVVVLVGGFTTNFLWCLALNARNRRGYQYFSSDSAKYPLVVDEIIVETALDAPSREVVEHMPMPKRENPGSVPMLRNYFFCAVAGTTWYFQFFFYTMGETQMGKYGFSSWTLHMASIIIFSTLWGIGLSEWKGAGSSALRLLTLALFLLVGSTVIVGYGNYLALAP